MHIEKNSLGGDGEVNLGVCLTKADRFNSLGFIKVWFSDNRNPSTASQMENRPFG
jgi:hypothetical protein